MRKIHVPLAILPITRARSNTLGIEVLDARTAPVGSRKYRSTSLCACAAVSGHHSAPSNTFPALFMLIGMSQVIPVAMLTLPHHAQPWLGRCSGPAPVVLSNEGC